MCLVACRLPDHRRQPNSCIPSLHRGRHRRASDPSEIGCHLASHLRGMDLGDRHQQCGGCHTDPPIICPVILELHQQHPEEHGVGNGHAVGHIVWQGHDDAAGHTACINCRCSSWLLHSGRCDIRAEIRRPLLMARGWAWVASGCGGGRAGGCAGHGDSEGFPTTGRGHSRGRAAGAGVFVGFPAF